MIPVNRILLAIDFNEATPRVLEFGRTLADACGASLYLLHVIGYPLREPETEARDRQAALARLEALLDRADREQRHVTTCCLVGTPAPEIARYAAEHAIDLIVMGTHSHGPTFQMLTGSIAESVMGLAPCAILAVKSRETAPYEAAFDPVTPAVGGV